MHWHHSLILVWMIKNSWPTTHGLHLEYIQYWPIKVSFCTCSFIFMCDRMLRTILWSWTCPHTLTDKIITQTIFAAWSTSGLFPHLGKTPGQHIWYLPQVFICHWLSVDQFLSLQDNPVWATIISSPRALASGGGLSVALGCHDICLLLDQFHVTSITQSELSSLTSLKAWGDLEKFQSNIAFLLVLTEECTAGDRVYCLSIMWVNPYQARLSTVEEAVKHLAPLFPTGPKWPYCLVQLNVDVCHVPLTKEGHLSILMEGGTDSAVCRWTSQLDICQLLNFSSQVIYLVRLNRCEIPVITSLPESFAKGITMLVGKPIHLSVDILQSALKGQESKAPSPGGHSIPMLTASPIRALYLRQKGESAWPQKLLSCIISDTSEQALGVPSQRG